VSATSLYGDMCVVVRQQGAEFSSGTALGRNAVDSGRYLV